ncbi:MAG TPA: heme-binding domain-containing protein [Acidobacteriaceae bacterium]
MSWVRRGVGPFSALALVASLLLARVHPFGDAHLYGATAPQASLTAGAQIMPHTTIPPAARTLLATKCADCHSAQAHAPFYGHFAPISWLMERDIVEGRKHMNLSQWDSYSPDEQQTLIAKIAQETKSHEMPLPQYRMIHRDSNITAADVEVLSQWAHGDKGGAPGLASETWDSTATAGDPIHGKQLFEKRCTGCHALTQNHEGPQLQGVYNRTTGTIPNFNYSAALKNAHIAWNDQTLDKWLTDPDAFLPGNNMDFLVAKPQERKDIIAWFKQSAGK